MSEPTAYDMLVRSIGDLKADMRQSFDRLEGKIDEVCKEVEELRTARAVDAALATQADLVAKHAVQAAADHVQTFRWRTDLFLGIVVVIGVGVLQLLIKVWV